jgi:hypothetical protein
VQGLYHKKPTIPSKNPHARILLDNGSHVQ